MFSLELLIAILGACVLTLLILVVLLIKENKKEKEEAQQEAQKLKLNQSHENEKGSQFFDMDDLYGTTAK